VANVRVSSDVDSETLGSAGLSLSLGGRLFDRGIGIRIDAPLYVSRPLLARDHADREGAFRWTWTLTVR
jgi:hypothetical protein